ncbi:long-chain-fatty-acid--CoA ligase [Pseudomonas mangrovi]|uniref:Long-chain-fatty-acid--CoA ligase n=1 Tax=Pseudomonas mangrovi TaxID=2161748 RepID=A0A2T5P9E8_9PSED|nr:long-chain fatty acid--CoA ligase [Pseudomonas mangrovi]PTU74342.1 long-chain fatty acid--CoA ligase [Pseudomonas mangrovi]
MSSTATGYVAAQLAANPLHNVYDLLAQAAAAHPDWRAFTCGDTSFSNAEFLARVDAFASYLTHHSGLQRGDRIAVMMPNGLQYPVVTYAIFKAGLIQVNTNPQYTRDEALHQFRDSGAKALIVLDRLLPLVRSLQADTDIGLLIISSADDFENPQYATEEVGAIRFMQALRLGEQSPPTEAVRGIEDVCLLQYTGGTTGVAKGAMICHRNLLACVIQCSELFLQPGRIEPGKDTRIAPLPLYHIMAFVTNMLLPVGLGIHTVYIRDARNLDEMVGAMRKHDFTLMNGINALFVGLMAHPDFDKIDFSRVKYANSGGAPLNSAVEQRWIERTGSVIREGFGMTETSAVVSTGTPWTPHGKGSVGAPTIDTEVRAVREDGSDAPTGEPGELWIRGPQVMLGYWGRPEATADTLTADGWLKTGDICTIDEQGLIRIVDRKKDMILVSGFNVFPNEVEDVVVRCPGVRECVAVGVPDEKKGEAVKIFVSLLDPKVTEAQLIAHCREHLTGYKIPSFVEIRAELPKSSVGKLLRRELRDEARKAAQA